MPSFGETLTYWSEPVARLQDREPMGLSRDELIQRLGDVAAPMHPALWQSPMAEDAIAPARDLTLELVGQEADVAEAEYKRYSTVPEREKLTITEETEAALHEKLAGKTILVTGGTGEIGGRLMGMLAGYNPGRLVSLSRGMRKPAALVKGAEYVYMRSMRGKSNGDDEDIFYAHAYSPVDNYEGIGDQEALTAHVKEIKPDIIFHVAAQRSPGDAERQPSEALRTNVFGTRNLINAAVAEAAETSQETGVVKTPEIVYASTGKALRPYSPDVYAASKQAAEWLLAKAVAEGQIQASGARFTHVVDNALVLNYVNRWVDSGEPVRVHDPYGEFYAQSATESAQLCLLSLLEGQPDAFNLSAITNLREPIRLLDMVMGAMLKRGKIAPIYLSGHDKGYEEEPYPYLYGMDMGDYSPLISAYERPVRDGKTTDEIDVFSVYYAENKEFDERLVALEEAVYGTNLDLDKRTMTQELSWARLQGKLMTTPADIIMRAVHRIKREEGRRQFNEEHQQTNDVMMAAADRYSADR